MKPRRLVASFASFGGGLACRGVVIETVRKKGEVMVSSAHAYSDFQGAILSEGERFDDAA